MPADKADHATRVRAWLEGATKGLTEPQLVVLFEQATNALWRRASGPLGEVTLAAIFDRVLYTATERHALLAAVRVDETGVHFDDLQLRSVRGAALREGIRFVLTEFLVVLGRVTDEILTPALHATLSEVTLDEPAPGERSERRRGGKDSADDDNDDDNGAES